MIDLFLFVGLLVSMGAFIHIQKQSLKAEVQQPIKNNINWYPLIVISKSQFRQAGYQLNKILLSMYCFKNGRHILYLYCHRDHWLCIKYTACSHYLFY
ncbi:hypothetical protein P4S68_03235 [Pseudoalteromonas sp. Hal099]